MPDLQSGRVVFNFTFHSGYIPIISPAFCHKDIALFTFHSGYIPMWNKVLRAKNPAILYIPFWIYSN